MREVVDSTTLLKGMLHSTHRHKHNTVTNVSRRHETSHEKVTKSKRSSKEQLHKKHDLFELGQETWLKYITPLENCQRLEQQHNQNGMYKYIKLLQLHENQEMPLSNHMRIAKKIAFFRCCY